MKIIVVLVLFVFSNNAFAQDIEVKKFEPLEKDQTVLSDLRKDNNGNPCAMIQVQSLKEGLEFEGWVVGNVERTQDMYLVYMAGGAKHVKIKHPDYPTKDVVFSEYNINSLKSGDIYRLSLVDETKDIVNKVYKLGWNIDEYEVPSNVKQIITRSASRGDKRAIKAMIQLSVGDENSSEGLLQVNKGLSWIEKLLEKGDSACLDSLPAEMMYWYSHNLLYAGIRNHENREKERELYTKACLYLLKACLKGFNEAGDDFFEYYPQSNGLPQYKTEARRLCLDSIAVGNQKAFTCLGIICEKGISETVNIEEAAKWYKKANEIGPTVYTRSNLCRIYGNKQYPIDKESLSFIKNQALEGLQEAFFQLGCMYEEGRNVPKDIDKAIELYKQAKPTIYDTDNHRGAAYRLAKICYDRNDLKQAEEYLRGTDSEDLDARFLQAIMLYQDTRNYKVDAFNILSDLSKKGYRKAKDFIKNNY